MVHIHESHYKYNLLYVRILTALLEGIVESLGNG